MTRCSVRELFRVCDSHCGDDKRHLLRGCRGFSIDAFAPRGSTKPFQPGALSFGEVAGVDLDALDGVVERHAAFDVGEELFVAESFAGLRVGGGSEGAGSVKGSDFIEEAGFHHLFDAGVDARVDEFGGPVQDDEAVGNFGFGIRDVGLRSIPLCLVGADGFAGEVEDFEGADGAAFVIGVDALGGVGVDAFEFFAECREAFGAELISECVIGAGAFEEAVEEGFDVEVGAADDDGGFVAGLNIGDGALRFAEPVMDCEGGGIARVAEVEEMVGDALAFGDGRLGGADVHAFIDLKGVGGDEFGGLTLRGEGVGKFDGEGGLATGGGAGDDGDEGERSGHAGLFARRRLANAQSVRRRSATRVPPTDPKPHRWSLGDGEVEVVGGFASAEAPGEIVRGDCEVGGCHDFAPDRCDCQARA